MLIFCWDALRDIQFFCWGHRTTMRKRLWKFKCHSCLRSASALLFTPSAPLLKEETKCKYISRFSINSLFSTRSSISWKFCQPSAVVLSIMARACSVTCLGSQLYDITLLFTARLQFKSSTCQRRFFCCIKSFEQTIRFRRLLAHRFLVWWFKTQFFAVCGNGRAATDRFYGKAWATHLQSKPRPVLKQRFSMSPLSDYLMCVFSNNNTLKERATPFYVEHYNAFSQ